jgi:hypothetical protein
MTTFREALEKRVMSTELNPDAVTPDDEMKTASCQDRCGLSSFMASKNLSRHALVRVTKAIQVTASLVNEIWLVISSTWCVGTMCIELAPRRVDLRDCGCCPGNCGLGVLSSEEASGELVKKLVD